MLSFLKQEWKFFVVLLLVIAIVVIIYFEYRDFRASYHPQQVQQPSISINTAGEKSQAGEPKVVYLEGTNTHTQEIVYVPKEVDPKTGEMEKTDVQFENRQNKVYVKVNGKEFEVPVDSKGDTKFEKGKLVVTDQSEMRINITAPKPQFNLGVGWSKNGAALQANGPLYKNIAWWMYGDKKTVAGGIQFPIMK